MSQEDPPRIVAVIGSARCTPEEEIAAEAVGRLLAETGVMLLCGGRTGIMAAACRGALSAGGLTIGILPGEDKSEANPWVQVPIATGLGEARNAIVARAADGVIAIGGSYGTLTELGYALKWGRRVVGLDTWEMSRGGELDVRMLRADTPEEAVRLALGHLE